MTTLLVGVLGFILGLFFGWLLHRERVARGADRASVPDGGQATVALADTSAKLELADQDVVDLQSQLSESQRLLDERAAVIAELETELAELREEPIVEFLDDEVVVEPLDAKTTDVVTEASAEELADAVTAETDTVPADLDLDEVDVTEEVVVPPPATDAEEPAADAAETAETAEPAEPVVEAPEPPETAPPEPAAAEPDDLRRIRGIGPAMERLLNEQGIVTFRQLALLDDAGVKELEAKLPGVPGRIRRDRWVEQAHELHVETHGDQP